jgi:hypothetical protein
MSLYTDGTTLASDNDIIAAVVDRGLLERCRVRYKKDRSGELEGITSEINRLIEKCKVVADECRVTFKIDSGGYDDDIKYNPYEWSYDGIKSNPVKQKEGLEKISEDVTRMVGLVQTAKSIADDCGLTFHISLQYGHTYYGDGSGGAGWDRSDSSC